MTPPAADYGNEGGISTEPPRVKLEAARGSQGRVDGRSWRAGDEEKWKARWWKVRRPSWGWRGNGEEVADAKFWWRGWRRCCGVDKEVKKQENSEREMNKWKWLTSRDEGIAKRIYMGRRWWILCPKFKDIFNFPSYCRMAKEYPHHRAPVGGMNVNRRHLKKNCLCHNGLRDLKRQRVWKGLQTSLHYTL